MIIVKRFLRVLLTLVLIISPVTYKISECVVLVPLAVNGVGNLFSDTHYSA